MIIINYIIYLAAFEPCLWIIRASCSFESQLSFGLIKARASNAWGICWWHFSDFLLKFRGSKFSVNKWFITIKWLLNWYNRCFANNLWPIVKATMNRDINTGALPELTSDFLRSSDNLIDNVFADYGNRSECIPYWIKVGFRNVRVLQWAPFCIAWPCGYGFALT